MSDIIPKTPALRVGRPINPTPPNIHSLPFTISYQRVAPVRAPGHL